MKNLLTIILLAAGIHCFAQAGTKNFIDQNYIEVTGKAEMEVVPDQIFLKIKLNEQDYKGKLTLEELERDMIRALADIGLDPAKDIAIQDMASNFKNYWIKNTKIYTTKEYQLRCKDAYTAGQVFRELEKLEISNINIDRIEHSEIEKFRKEVKIEAVKAAREKAKSLAEAIDQQLGKAIFIQEQNIYPVRNQSGYLATSNIMIRRNNAQEADISPEIEFEKIKLEYSILARFELN